MVVAEAGRLIAMFSSGDGDFVAACKQETGEKPWRYRIEEIYKGHDGSHRNVPKSRTRRVVLVEKPALFRSRSPTAC